MRNVAKDRKTPVGDDWIILVMVIHWNWHVGMVCNWAAGFRARHGSPFPWQHNLARFKLCNPPELYKRGALQGANFRASQSFCKPDLLWINLCAVAITLLNSESRMTSWRLNDGALKDNLVQSRRVSEPSFFYRSCEWPKQRKHANHSALCVLHKTAGGQWFKEHVSNDCEAHGSQGLASWTKARKNLVSEIIVLFDHHLAFIALRLRARRPPTFTRRLARRHALRNTLPF